MASISKLSTPTGILRRRPSVEMSGKTTVARVRDNDIHLGSPTSRTGVHFAAPDNLTDLLLRLATCDKEQPIYRKTEEELAGLVTHLRNAKGSVLVEWLQQIQRNVAMLKPKLENFVLSMLRIGWADQDANVVSAYREFLVNLVTAQLYYTKPVVKMLVSNLSGITDRNAFNENKTLGNDENNTKTVEGVEQVVFQNTHDTIKAILKVSPLASRAALLQYVRECQPYALTADTHLHTNYIQNILRITEYIQGDEDARTVILSILTERLVQLDAHIDKNDEDEEEVYELTEGNDNNSLEHLNKRAPPSMTARSNLDAAMDVLFSFITVNCKDDEASDQAAAKENGEKENEPKQSIFKQTTSSKQIYRDLLKCFEVHVLPAHGTGHVQFFLFYFLNSKQEFADQYLKWLWSKFISPNTPQILRQASMAYIASFISRAQCINKVTLMGWLKKICTWIHTYIDQSWHSSANAGSHAHGAFYAACQAVFYMFVFRQDEFKESKNALDRLSKLGLQPIVTCHLNPLRFCLPTIVTNFSAVAKHFQVAYCDTIVQKNARLHLPQVGAIVSHSRSSNDAKPVLLDTFFPFDPYKLSLSKKYVEPHYREYHGNIELENEDDDSSDEEEVIMGEQDDSEDDNEEENENLKRYRRVDSDDSYVKTPKRRRLSSTRSSISTGSLVDFGYAYSPGFKLK